MSLTHHCTIARSNLLEINTDKNLTVENELWRWLETDTSVVWSSSANNMICNWIKTNKRSSLSWLFYLCSALLVNYDLALWYEAWVNSLWASSLAIQRYFKSSIKILNSPFQMMTKENISNCLYGTVRGERANASRMSDLLRWRGSQNKTETCH